MAQDDIEHPIMPTGFGVADLKVAREEDALESGEAEGISPPEQAPMDDAAGGPQADDADDDLPGVTASGAE